MRRLIALFICAYGPAQAAELAVVIDDIGYSIERGMRAINLPGPVTLAVLPFAPNTQYLARQAMLSGKDVIVHQPMEPYPANHVHAEHGTLTLEMEEQEFDRLLSASIDAVPGRIGLSNHTGSLLTQHRAPMRQLMLRLETRGLFFLDSRTTSDTVAFDVARELGVPAITRDVFLDHERMPQAISREFERAIELARRNGQALIIAHPYRASLSYLEKQLASLPPDVRLVSAKDLIRPTVAGPPQHQDDLRISHAQ